MTDAVQTFSQPAAGEWPIRRKLMQVILLTSGAVLLLTSLGFLGYEYFAFRQSAVRNLTTLGQVIAANSTAALAFDNPDDAQEIMSALKAEPHVVAAALYDDAGGLFATYPVEVATGILPASPAADGYRFEAQHLIGLQSVSIGGRRLGTLYIKSDLGAFYDWLRVYGGITFLVIGASFVAAYLLSHRLQRQISDPILALADTARAISAQRDYTMRAPRPEVIELGHLTDAFNHMVERAHEQLGRLDLLQRITRAIGERQDLPSIFQVMLRRLENDLPIDFGCLCLYDPSGPTLVTKTIGGGSQPLAQLMKVQEGVAIPIDANGLTRCLQGELVYEPDVREVQFPFPQRLAQGGLRSLVIAPLLIESKVFGILVAARKAEHAFTSADCEFLRQISEHTGLATHQAQLYGALQQAYEDLRQSQQTVLQQERLRALGQMASGIAHDINNAISPVMLYTESLLERETNLSDRARACLITIQQAVEDVASTVARMREFYRPRESQLVLTRVRLNRTIQQVLDLTRARWRDEPQQRGIVIRLHTDLEEHLPEIMGADGEIRDALTNLVFNAVDAMGDGGGVLTIKTRELDGPVSVEGSAQHVALEVSDTGIGMDEETRRRCLEPFYTTKGERGTGLGLAMVYGMIKRHSADLEIDSEPGKGTTVRLVFAVPAFEPASTIPPLAPPTPARSLRVLVVDDDPLLIQSLRGILESDGHVVTAAEGGQKGIDLAIESQRRGAPFDIVITDLGMPYVDGRRVAAAVREACPRVPIVMLTGWGQRLVAENDVPPQVNRVLNKPPRLHELRSALTDLAPAANF